MTATARNYPVDDDEQRDEYIAWCRRTGRMARFCMFEDELEFEDDNPGAGSSSDAP